MSGASLIILIIFRGRSRTGQAWLDGEGGGSGHVLTEHRTRGEADSFGEIQLLGGLIAGVGHVRDELQIIEARDRPLHHMELQCQSAAPAWNGRSTVDGEKTMC